MDTLDNAVAIRLASGQDLSKWNQYVDVHNQGTPYHQLAWLNAVKKSYGFDGFHIVAVNRSTNDLVGILPLVLIKVPIKGKSLCALPYCDIGGPLSETAEISSQMVAFARTLGENHKAKRLEVRSSSVDENSTQHLDGAKVRMLLALPDNSESLMASFKSKLRSQIRKAEKNGLSFSVGSNQTLLDDFYHVYCVNMRDLGSPVHHKTWFEQIIKCYDKKAIISVVYKDQTPVGGGIVLLNERTACIPWASTIQAFNRLAPNMLLYWSLLAHCADNHITTFDFGRSTYNQGTFKFKKQWGAEPVKLQWQKYHLIGQLEDNESIEKDSSIRTRIEFVWRNLPLALTNFIGGRVRKYISL